MLNSDLFSRNLYMYRTKAGMTQKEVAEKIGIRQQTVAAWEANRSTPCPDIIGIDVYKRQFSIWPPKVNRLPTFLKLSLRPFQPLSNREGSVPVR